MLLLKLAFVRRIFLYSPFLTCLYACGPNPTEDPAFRVKPEAAFATDLQPLLQAYIKDSEVAGAPVSPEFRAELVQLVWDEDMGMDGDRTVLGRCERLNEGALEASRRFRTVHIRKPGSDGKVNGIVFDETTLKTIVYHELGHCLHDFRGHLPEASHQIMSSGLPQERFQSFNELLEKHFALVKAR